MASCLYDRSRTDWPPKKANEQVSWVVLLVLCDPMWRDLLIELLWLATVFRRKTERVGGRRRQSADIARMKYTESNSSTPKSRHTLEKPQRAVEPYEPFGTHTHKHYDTSLNIALLKIHSTKNFPRAPAGKASQQRKLMNSYSLLANPLMFIHVSGILLCCCIVSFQIHVDSISFLSGASLYYVCSGRMLQVLKGSFWRYQIRTWTGSWKTYIKYVCIYIYILYYYY